LTKTDTLDIVYDRTADDFYVVFTSNRAALEGAPAYDRAADTAARRDSWDMPRETGMMDAPAATDMMAAEPVAPDATAPAASGGLSDDQPPVVAEDTTLADGAAAPAVDGTMAEGATTDGTTAADGTMAADGIGVIPPMEGYADADRAVLTAEDLQDANVYDATNADIASVSEVLLTADGQIDQVIVDVGGFLGMGAKPVAIPFDSLTLWQNADNSDLRIYLPMTREQLEALPDYAG